MRRFTLARELPLTEQERQHRERFYAVSDGRPPLELVNDLGWLDAHALRFRGRMGSRLQEIPGLREKKLPFALQRHDRYFLLHMHTHTWLELLCVIHGSCAHRVGSITGTLQAGDVLVISPGTQHAFLVASDDCIVYNVYLPLELFEQDCSAVLRGDNELATFLLKTLYADGRDSWLIFHTGAYFLQENCLAELWWEFEHPQRDSAQRMTALLQLLLLDLLRHQAAPVSVSIDAPRQEGRDQMLVAYVRNHSDLVTVNQLSRLFGYSERQITRIFQQVTGMSCIDFIQQCRMERFVSLLVGTDLSITRAMELAGVRSTQRFYRIFKANYGASPAAYRQRYRQA